MLSQASGTVESQHAAAASAGSCVTPALASMLVLQGAGHEETSHSLTPSRMEKLESRLFSELVFLFFDLMLSVWPGGSKSLGFHSRN